MAVPGSAITGRLSSGKVGSEAEWLRPTAEAAQDAAVGAIVSEAEDAHSKVFFSNFGSGQSEAEAQLYAYLDRVKGPMQGGFAPYRELTSRLNEFQPTMGAGTAIAEPGLATPAEEQTTEARGWNPSDRPWLDAKFAELREIIVHRDSEKSQLASIEEKLGSISDRLDRLAADMPGEFNLATIESRFDAIAQSLEAAGRQSISDAERISHSAREIMSLQTKAEEAQSSFEAVARHTIEELAQTVHIASSQAGLIAAEHIANLLRGDEKGGLDRLEGELLELDIRSRESSDRTATALDRMHETLRFFLEEHSFRIATPPTPRKRVGVHVPIAAGAAAYTHPDAAFGSAPLQRPQLDTITLRTPPPPNDNFIKALQEADERLSAARGHNPAANGTAADSKASATMLKYPIFREEERSLPLFGLGIVAIVLLLASATLYYLHTRAQTVPFHLTLVPQGSEAMSPFPIADPVVGPSQPGKLTWKGAAAPRSAEVSALFTAGEQSRQTSNPATDNAKEDVQLLTAAAAQGDSDAQYRVGARFLKETPFQAAAVTAARWFAKAADQGHVEALFMLASLYERGLGVAREESHAITLYRRAAFLGHVRSMHNLGVLLSARETGEGYREAAGWFDKAATAGLTESQYNLALLYERGLGFEEDLAKAYFWYKVAAISGDREALQSVERLKRLLPPSEMQTVAQQAGSWRPSLTNTRRPPSENAPS